jgi:hypothetical protein
MTRVRMLSNTSVPGEWEYYEIQTRDIQLSFSLGQLRIQISNFLIFLYDLLQNNSIKFYCNDCSGNFIF